MSTGPEIADRAVGHCDHVPERLRPHDWACAVCIAKEADAVLANRNARIERLERAADERLEQFSRLQAESRAMFEEATGKITERHRLLAAERNSLEKQLAEVTREREEARAGVMALDGALRDCVITRHTDLALGHPNNISECPDWICKLSLRALHPSPEGSNAQAEHCKPSQALRVELKRFRKLMDKDGRVPLWLIEHLDSIIATGSSAPAAPKEHK